jgi:DNA-binding HxlR family transcriptional regulator
MRQRSQARSDEIKRPQAPRDMGRLQGQTTMSNDTPKNNFDPSKFFVANPPAQQKVNQRYQLLTAANFFEPQAPIMWTVHGLISAGSVNVFFGEAGCGKTWALLDMGVCVADGAPWLGMATTAGPVLIIDEESGQRRLSRRMGEVLRGHGANDRTPIMATSLAAFDMGNPNDIGEVYNLIISTGARLVIIDALADIMPNRDENAVKDTAPIFLSLRKIAEETQAAIIVIHHSNKAGGYRGSSAIKGAIDLLLSVEKKNDNNNVTFKTEKTRDTTAGAFGATMNFMDDKFWMTAAEFEKTAQAYSKGERYVMRYLLANSESSVSDISDHADTCAATTARNSVYALADKGITTRTNGGGKGVNATYKLTEAGRALAEAN